MPQRKKTGRRVFELYKTETSFNNEEDWNSFNEKYPQPTQESRKLLRRDTLAVVCFLGFETSVKQCIRHRGKGKVVPVLSFNWAPHHKSVLGKWKYSSTRSLTSGLDEGEWSALHLGKEPPLPIVYESAWAPEPVWTWWWRENFPTPAGNRPPLSSSPKHSAIPLRYPGSWFGQCG
jgi:hypothetical protein